jgi:large subunit ribosomal protein L9
MKVILKENVPNLGNMGDTVQVADGFGRNYLIPQGKAMPATSKSLKALEHERRLLQRKVEAAREEAEGLAGRIRELTLTIPRKVVAEDRLYGSVSVSDIAQVLEESGVSIERKQIRLEEPIKTVGEYRIPIKVHAEVTVELTVQVVEEEKGP